MKSIIFHPLAQQELIDAVAYYENQKPGLGQDYLKEVENAVKFLTQYPKASYKVSASVHRLNLPKFPYFLLYSLVEDTQIRILAIAHHKRKPLYWINRQ